MIQNILIEGPDCSGKSTLVEQLKNKLKWDSKSLHHQAGDQFARYIKEYTQQKKVVFDRGHFSELVYSQLWRGGSPFKKEEKEILNQFCQMRMLVIFTCPPLELMKERHLKRKYSQQIKLEELEGSRKLFQEALEEVPFLIYTSQTYEELDKIIARVKGMI